MSLLAVIDKGLASLGENPQKTIWFCLEKDFNIGRNKVPDNLHNFEHILQRFFGSGYDFLETLFIKYLSEATGEKLDRKTSFVDCVTRLRGSVNEELAENVIVQTPHVTENSFGTGK
jgi:hypothetical protein